VKNIPGGLVGSFFPHRGEVLWVENPPGEKKGAGFLAPHLLFPALWVAGHQRKKPYVFGEKSPGGASMIANPARGYIKKGGAINTNQRGVEPTRAGPD